MAAEIEDELDQLYGADLDEFVRRRNDLAKRVREGGDREAAEHIRGLQKPSVVAWAANQVAREAPAELERLLEAGDRLRAAQREVLKGAAPAALEEARRGHEEAVRRLVGQAGRLLEQKRGTATGSTLDRLASTLRAATVHDEARDRLKHGRLAEEVEATGFEALAQVGGLAATPARGRKARKEPDRRDQMAELREALKQARQAERDLQAEARKAEREAEKARRQAEKLEREASAAAREAEAASAARAESEQRLREARR